jgi:hypothetical protein
MTLHSFQERFRKSPSIVTRDIAGEIILVPIRQHVGDLDSVYTLNETASRIWALIDGQRSVGDIRDAIVAEFETGPDEAGPDVVALLGQLQAAGAVEKA